MAKAEQATDRGRVVDALLRRQGRTFADEAGIRLTDRPQPLYQLLVLATLLSARISAGVAMAAARELFAAGYRSPRAMRDAGWQARVDALGPRALPALRRAHRHPAGRRRRAVPGPVEV